MKNVEKYKNLKVCEIWDIYQNERKNDPDLTFQEFLDREEYDYKFNPGDLVQIDRSNPLVEQWRHDAVFEIEDRIVFCGKPSYCVKFLTPSGGFAVMETGVILADFVDSACRPY